MVIAGCCAAPEHVGHHRHRRDGVGVAERIVQHRPQVLFELAGARAVHGPVPGVVRPHGQLVDQQCAAGRLEQLHGQQADHAEFGGHPQRQLLRPAAATASGSAGAGAITSTQIPSRCTVSTTGHAAP